MLLSRFFLCLGTPRTLWGSAGIRRHGMPFRKPAFPVRTHRLRVLFLSPPAQQHPCCQHYAIEHKPDESGTLLLLRHHDVLRLPAQPSDQKAAAAPHQSQAAPHRQRQAHMVSPEAPPPGATGVPPHRRSAPGPDRADSNRGRWTQPLSTRRRRQKTPPAPPGCSTTRPRPPAPSPAKSRTCSRPPPGPAGNGPAPETAPARL